MRLQVSVKKLPVPGAKLISLQVLRIYLHLLRSLYRFLYMADCDIRVPSQAADGHVSVLHTSPANPRRMCSLPPCLSENLRHILSSRLIFRRSPGQKSSAELAPSVNRTHLRPCHPNLLPMAQLLPPSSTPTILPIVFCDKKTTLSPFLTKNYSICVSLSRRFFSASFRLRKVRDVCLPRRWSGIYAFV